MATLSSELFPRAADAAAVAVVLQVQELGFARGADFPHLEAASAAVVRELHAREPSPRRVSHSLVVLLLEGCLLASGLGEIDLLRALMGFLPARTQPSPPLLVFLEACHTGQLGVMTWAAEAFPAAFLGPLPASAAPEFAAACRRGFLEGAFLLWKTLGTAACRPSDPDEPVHPQLARWLAERGAPGPAADEA